MKKILFSAMFFTSIASHAQKVNDNAVLIPSIGISEDKIMEAIVSSGYAIENHYKNYFLTSGVKKFNGNSIKISVLMNDSLITFTGLINANVSLMGAQSSYERIVFKTGSFGAWKKAFSEIVLVAKKLSTDVRFIKQ